MEVVGPKLLAIIGKETIFKGGPVKMLADLWTTFLTGLAG